MSHTVLCDIVTWLGLGCSFIFTLNYRVVYLSSFFIPLFPSILPTSWGTSFWRDSIWNPPCIFYEANLFLCPVHCCCWKEIPLTLRRFAPGHSKYIKTPLAYCLLKQLSEPFRQIFSFSLSIHCNKWMSFHFTAGDKELFVPHPVRSLFANIAHKPTPHGPHLLKKRQHGPLFFLET